jgi:hypothetical protein
MLLFEHVNHIVTLLTVARSQALISVGLHSALIKTVRAIVPFIFTVIILGTNHPATVQVNHK